MVKSAVRVVVRTRPTDAFAADNLALDAAASTIGVHLKKSENQGVVNNQQENWSFKFDDVMHNATQEAVYDTCVAPVVKSVLEGYNGTVMTYGQTGAGKTFTMMGGADNYQYRGVVPRAIAHVFRHVRDQPDVSFNIRVSYTEIYNEMMYDLLSVDGDIEGGGKLQIMDDERGAVVVRGLTRRPVASEEEALNFVFEGEMNRSIAEHQLNAQSSRSHCIFTMWIESRSRVESNERIMRSKLHLVDLAGSERVKKTHSEGVILKEATYINKSLTFLEQVVIALTDKHRDHVPFRQSKLTNMLRDSLGGNCKTVMIANVWPEERHIDETISTLRFATRMMRVATDATVNVEYDPVVLCQKYEAEIKELKQELAMRDALAGRAQIDYEDYSEEQRYELRRTLKSYLDGDAESDAFQVTSIRYVKELLGQMRQLWRDASAHVPAGAGGGAHGDAGGASRGVASPEVVPNTSGVGEIVGGSGALGGIAPADARPPAEVAGGAPSAALTSAQLALRERGLGGAAGDEAARPTDRNEAFEVFKTSDGADINRALVDAKAQLVEKKRASKALAQQVNDAKHTIDQLRASIEAKQGARQQLQGVDADVIDEEEFELMRQLKNAKEAYRQLHDKFREARSETQFVERSVEQHRQQLVAAFDEWYTAAVGTSASGGGARDRSAPGADGGAADDDSAYMDDAERFEEMQKQRILSEDPTALAFFNARKTAKKHAQLGQHRAPAGNTRAAARR